MRTREKLQIELRWRLNQAIDPWVNFSGPKIPDTKTNRDAVYDAEIHAYIGFYKGLSDAEIDEYQFRHPFDVGKEELVYIES